MNGQCGVEAGPDADMESTHFTSRSVRRRLCLSRSDGGPPVSGAPSTPHHQVSGRGSPAPRVPTVSTDLTPPQQSRTEPDQVQQPFSVGAPPSPRVPSACLFVISDTLTPPRQPRTRPDQDQQLFHIAELTPPHQPRTSSDQDQQLFHITELTPPRQPRTRPDQVQQPFHIAELTPPHQPRTSSDQDQQPFHITELTPPHQQRTSSDQVVQRSRVGAFMVPNAPSASGFIINADLTPPQHQRTQPDQIHLSPRPSRQSAIRPPPQPSTPSLEPLAQPDQYKRFNFRTKIALNDEHPSLVVVVAPVSTLFCSTCLLSASKCVTSNEQGPFTHYCRVRFNSRRSGILCVCGARQLGRIFEKSLIKWQQPPMRVA